jgi:AmiR/NasT family two-component response regulator
MRSSPASLEDPLDSATPLRVVIADDHVLLRQGVASMLDGEGFEVVAQAGDAEDVIRKVNAHHPDVAVRYPHAAERDR